MALSAVASRVEGLSGKAVLLVAALCLTAGCSKKKAYSRSSETATAPAGAPFSRATAHIAFEPSRQGLHGTRSAQVTLKLKLQGAAGDQEVKLDEFLEPRGLFGKKVEPGGTSPATFKRMMKPDFELRFSPDGQALGVSVDGGKAFRKVAFDAGAPLYCVHEAFSLKHGWAAAPATRRLVLDILKSTDPPTEKGTLHLEPGEHPRGRGRFEREFRVASAHACKHLEDAELREAVVRSLVRPGSQIFGEDWDLLRCVGQAAKTHASERKLLLSALTGTASEQLARAALALGEVAEPSVQQALASALRAPSAACVKLGKACKPTRSHTGLAIALARVTTELEVLSGEVRDVALDLSHSASPALQVYAIRALAVSKEESVKDRLGEMSVGECREGVAKWDTDFTKIRWLAKDKYAPACWAQAALKRMEQSGAKQE